MLAYAANRPVAARAPSSPPAMLIIISAHVALIALIMSAKMEFRPVKPEGTTVVFVPAPAPPPPPNGTTSRHQHPTNIPTAIPDPNVALPHFDPDPLDPGTIDTGTAIGSGGANSIPHFPTQLIPAPIRHEPRLLTRPDELKPPYPQSKILSEEEATLRLRLTISDSGRVIAVDPVGAADRIFLAAARNYLIAHWRYSPATEDGRAIASSVVISLQFRLDG
jgi:protein TonB